MTPRLQYDDDKSVPDKTDVTGDPRLRMDADTLTFDITCTVGTITLGGTEHWLSAAMSLIGSHEASGLYRFPDLDTRQGYVTVIVERDRDE